MPKRFIGLSLLLLFISAVSADELPQSCQQDCVATFGLLAGESPTGVKAYSNCSSDCVFPKPNFHNGVYTGIKWQCVEYARRWLLINKGVVYGDVDIAADIWDVTKVHTPDKAKTYSLEAIVNGTANAELKHGDLLIYGDEFLGTGHVAVVLEVNQETQMITVGEQNFNNDIWREKSARNIPYIINDDALWLLDAYLIGWKRVLN